VEVGRGPHFRDDLDVTVVALQTGWDRHGLALAFGQDAIEDLRT
jgi:hypothetical protein